MNYDAVETHSRSNSPQRPLPGFNNSSHQQSHPSDDAPYEDIFSSAAFVTETDLTLTSPAPTPLQRHADLPEPISSPSQGGSRKLFNRPNITSPTLSSLANPFINAASSAASSLKNPFSDGSISSRSSASPKVTRSILKNRNTPQATSTTSPPLPPQQPVSATVPQIHLDHSRTTQDGYSSSLPHMTSMTQPSPNHSIGSLYDGTYSGPMALQQHQHGTHSNSISSTHRSSQNLSPMGDELYNTTSDATLEELADRWNAYQALMKKYYKETNFLKRWTRSKWMLCFTTSVLAAYSITALVIAMEYISQKADNAALIMEFHADMVYLCFSGAILGLIMVVVAVIGLIRENRIWLSWHSLFQWPIFFLFVSIGYIAFRRVNNHLRAHLHDEWVYDYSREQRLLVQNDLKCCGYMDSSWYAEYDMRCFPKTVLPGCIFKYNKFEEEFLNKSWQLSFALVPVQIFIMVSTLMTINHVDAMLRSGRPGLKSFKEQ